MPLVEVSESDVHALLERAREMRLAIGREKLDELAALAYLQAQDRAQRRGAVLSAKLARPYEALDDNERIGMRNAVRDVTIALVLLGYLELPQ